MLKISFVHYYEHIIGFNILGHADYDTYGKDIVCAAVSATSNMVCFGIDDIVHVGCKFCENDNGTLYCLLDKEKIDDESFEKAMVLINAFNKFVLQLAKQYEKHMLIYDIIVE